MDREQIDAVVFRVQLDDVHETLLIAKTGDPAFQRILHREFRRDQRSYCLPRRFLQLGQMSAKFFDMITQEPLHATGIHDDRGATAARVSPG